MRLGMLLRYHGDHLALDEVLEAERLGYNSVWSGEAYGTDAVTPTAWILARTTGSRPAPASCRCRRARPACTAMTALTLQALSNNRFLLGIGASGPQVVEGWHGVPFGKPMARTREYIEILRKILKREAPLQHDGELYQIPYKGPGATGLGKPLKSILHGEPEHPDLHRLDHADRLRRRRSRRRRAADLHVAGEDRDGDSPAEGIAKAGGGRSLADFDVVPFVRIVMGADLQAAATP